MKSKNILYIILFFFLISCLSTDLTQNTAGDTDLIPNNDQPSINQDALLFTKYPNISNRVKNIYIQMSPIDQLAQLLIIRARIPGASMPTKMNDTLFTFLQKVQAGGIILFKSNINNNLKNTAQLETQLKKFIADINSTTTIPAFISIDVEGGSVNRLQNIQHTHIGTLPSASELASNKTSTQVHDLMNKVGNTLLDIGINMNFAPVADVTYKNTALFLRSRIFSHDPYRVALYVTASVQAFNKANVISVVKHFPGHGAGSKNTHFNIANLNISKEDFYTKDFIPFQSAINANVPAIMMGHLFAQALDYDAKVSELSPKIISILRDDINFKGVIITDSLSMNAVQNKYVGPYFEERMLKAGITVLLDPPNPMSLLQRLLSSLEDGRLSKKIVEKAVLQVLQLKENYNIL